MSLKKETNYCEKADPYKTLIIPLVNYRMRQINHSIWQQSNCLVPSFSCVLLHTLSLSLWFFFVCCRCFPSQGISSYVWPPWRPRTTLSLTPYRGKSRCRWPTVRLPPPFSFSHNTAEWPHSFKSQGRRQTPLRVKDKSLYSWGLSGPPLTPLWFWVKIQFEQLNEACWV